MEELVSYFPLTYLGFAYAVLHSILFKECKYLPLSANMGFTVLPHAMIVTSFLSYCSLLCNAFIFDVFQIAQVKTSEG